MSFDTITEIPFPAKVLKVKDLTGHIKSLLERDSLLQGVWIQGEISNLVRAASGHCYLTLKDEKSTVKAALWAGNRRRIKTEFKNGDQVLVYGSISVYLPRGEYQIIINDIRPVGIGALYEAFEKLKSKLGAEGLFDPDRKLPLPFLPKGIGIVTSSTGAVIQDIFRVIRRRYPNMPLYLVPAKVQGAGAADEIVTGINRLIKDERVDVIIIGRGGGSLEDLWPFNEEKVARAIAASHKPIVSAVGHETDTTIADFVADIRAATPSVAGELVVPVKADLSGAVERQSKRLVRSLKMNLELARKNYRQLESCRFLKKPSLLVAERRIYIMNLSKDLEGFFKRFVSSARHRFELLKSGLENLNPKALLSRGFIMAQDLDGKVITSVSQLKSRQSLNLMFADGEAEVGVKKVKKVDGADNDE